MFLNFVCFCFLPFFLVSWHDIYFFLLFASYETTSRWKDTDEEKKNGWLCNWLRGVCHCLDRGKPSSAKQREGKNEGCSRKVLANRGLPTPPHKTPPAGCTNTRTRCGPLRSASLVRSWENIWKRKKGRLPLRRLRKNARGETMLGCRLLTGQLFGYLSWLWTLSIHEYHDTSKALPDSSNFSTITNRQTQVEHPADLSLLASCVVAARDFKTKWKTNTGR